MVVVVMVGRETQADRRARRRRPRATGPDWVGSLGNGGRAGTFQVGLGRPGPRQGMARHGARQGRTGQGMAGDRAGTGSWAHWALGRWRGGVGEAAKQCTGPTPTKTDWTHQMGMTQGTSRVSPCWACTSNCQGRKG